MDTPVEPLHTILLGVVKYTWLETLKHIKAPAQQKEFQARLLSISTQGMSVPRIDVPYIMSHKKTLVGRSYKQIVQVIPFVLHQLVPADILECWLRLGTLTALCWYTAIENIDIYSVSILNFVSKIIKTYSFHLLGDIKQCN